MLIAVFDNRDTVKTIIREQLLTFSIQANIDMDVLWFDSSFQFDHLENYMESVCIALISLEDASFRSVGYMIAQNNPMCYICYYGNADEDLHPLLKTRPYEYLITGDMSKKVLDTIREIYENLLFADGYYHYSSKSVFWCCPIRSIAYFQSDLKYVYIVYNDTQTMKIRTTLDQVETDLAKRKLNGGFVRIHKSYLVNPRKIRSINKKDHTVQMDHGQILPISDAKYNTIIHTLEENCRFAG